MNRKVFICIALLAGALSACHKGEQGQEEQAVHNKTMVVQAQDCVVEESYPASIRGRQDIAIMPQVAGTLTQLCVVEGERVRKGQVLFIIDQVPYRASLETAEANVEVAKSSVATAELVYQSKQKLYADSVISDFDLQTAQNSYLSAKAGLAQANAALVIARNNLNYTEVKSPSDGVVGTLPFRVGALVSPQMVTPLTTVSDNSVMYVYFSMTENQWLALARQYGSKDAALRNMPAVELLLNDGSRYSEQGKIETVSGVIDQATGTVSVRATFGNKNGLLTSGGAGNIVLGKPQQGALLIPRTATYEVQDKVFVYRVADGKTVSTQVVVSRLNGGKEYIVKSGLQAGDTIVIEGVALLKEGTKLTPPTPSERGLNKNE